MPYLHTAALSIIITAFSGPVRAEADPTQDPSPHEFLVERMEDARKALAPVAVGTTRIGGQYAVLAAWNSGEDDLRIIRVRGGISRTNGFTVSLRRRNGVNSEYRVTEPEGYVVLAIKTNVKNPWPGRRTYPVVYTPYSTELHTPEMVDLGRKYLITLLDSAADRLDELAVKSSSQADTMVSEVAPERVLLTLLIVEHTSPYELREKGAAYVTEKVFVTAALNWEDVFNYAVSRAGARGLPQFISRTYHSIRRKYRQAELKRNFASGMSDHLNAVMAQYCLVDWILRMLPEEKLEALMQSDREEDLGAFIAASYNFGEERTYRVMTRNPRDWEKRGYGLPRETSNYLRTFRAVYVHLFPPPTENPDR